VNDFNLVGNEYWIIKFWICFSSSVIFIVLVIPALNLMKKGRLGLNENFTVAKFPSLNFFLCKLILFFGEILYLPIMCSMLSVFSCEGSLGEIKCLSATHLGYIFVSILTMILYYPTATLLFPSISYQDRALDLKFDTSYLVLESQGKVIIAAFAVLFNKNILVLLIVAIIVTTLLFFTCLKLKPCLVHSYNFWKAGGFLVPIWICTCALIKVVSNMKNVFEFILLPGLALIATALVFIYWKKYGFCKCRNRTISRRQIENNVTVIDAPPASERDECISDSGRDVISHKNSTNSFN
jgi:hypothetical protein